MNKTFDNKLAEMLRKEQAHFDEAFGGQQAIDSNLWFIPFKQESRFGIRFGYNLKDEILMSDLSDLKNLIAHIKNIKPVKGKYTFDLVSESEAQELKLMPAKAQYVKV